MSSSVLEAIYKRRSIREYTDDEVSEEQLRDIIQAGIWAPSGLNNQPWRFVTVRDEGVREQLAEQTHYSHIVRGCRALIAVYLDREAMYDDVKDHQSAGACIQNMLLEAHSLGLGACWVHGPAVYPRIVKQIKELLGIPTGMADYKMLAIVSVGWPSGRRSHPQGRIEPEEFVYWEKLATRRGVKWTK